MGTTGRGIAGQVYTGKGTLLPPSFQALGTNSGLTDGGVLIGQGNDPIVATGSGSAGQVLTSNGPGVDPSFQAAATGISSVLTANSTPQFALVGSTSTVDFGLSNLVLGTDLPALTVGNDNVGLGDDVFLALTEGNGNSAVGFHSMDSLTTGSNNVAVGKNTLVVMTGSVQNVAIGASALQNLAVSTGSNTAVGYASLDTITTGTANTALGEGAGGDLTTSDSSNIVIKNAGTPGDNNTIRIGTQGAGVGQQSRAFVAGITGVTVAGSAPIAVDTNGQVSSLGFGSATQILTSNGAGTSPTWQAAPATGGQTITGDDAVVLSPTAGNWNVLGQDAGAVSVMDTNGSVSTLRIENRTWITPFVVDPSATVGLRGTFQTIQAAINAAVAGQTIFIRPGNYTENITLIEGIQLLGGIPTGGSGERTKITGKIIDNGVALNATLTNICLTTNADFFLELTGANGTVSLFNCRCDCENNTGISLGAGKELALDTCSGSLATTGIAYWTGDGNLEVRTCRFDNSGGSSTASNLSGLTTIRNTYMTSPVSCSGAGILNLSNLTVDTFQENATSVVTAGTGTSIIANCLFSSGTASAISVGAGTTLSVYESTINSSNANGIDGAGTIRYGGLVFPSSSTISTTTQVPIVSSNDALKIVTPGAYPYTTVPQDAVILVDTSAARTITPLASPTTGQRHIIKDSVGSAAANNITVTPVGKNIDGAASFILNVNFGSITIVYSGTQWLVI